MGALAAMVPSLIIGVFLAVTANVAAGALVAASSILLAAVTYRLSARRTKYVYGACALLGVTVLVWLVVP